ncbi:hypothetical protein ZOSMA_18G00950 [Zostera marina]|uniref:RING-type domain-containing protein n=1 Tax=Zostera marina TaxID=29655 RepID=A0A0K9PPJ2_ZOSMR|nr:hypothetical protein ZOSMA_18G00950 [Zostera marina]
MEFVATLLIFFTFPIITLFCVGILIVMAESATRYVFSTALSQAALDLISIPDFEFYDNCNSNHQSDCIDSWLSSTALRRLKTTENCVFCLCHITVEEEIRELKCSHVFHRSCLDKWVSHGHLTCPLCRQSLLLQGSDQF